MATKKSLFVLLGLFFLMGGFSGFPNEVGAETLKLQVTKVVTKIEATPIENIEGAGLMPMIRDGVFASENGEVGSIKFIDTAYGVRGKGGSFLGYVVFMFGDGSTIAGTFQPGTWWPDPEKSLGDSKGVG